MENYIIRYGNENHLKVKITAYGSGSQLLLNFQKRKFDIIFLDVSMPELDGFETAERIRSIHPFTQYQMQGKVLKWMQRISYQSHYYIKR